MNRNLKYIAMIVAVIVIILLIIPVVERKEMRVGKQIKADDIRDFYYTYSSSTDPPEYQRYRFYTEDDKHYFYHEKREGDHWPLREDDITISGTSELSDEEWDHFFEILSDGLVTARTESTDSGDAGPWTFIYWKNDKNKYQEYQFLSYERRLMFEEYCRELLNK